MNETAAVSREAETPFGVGERRGSAPGPGQREMIFGHQCFQICHHGFFS